MSRIGVLGGTFDPIHLGHLAAAKAALDCAHLDRVLFVPSGRPPHRPAALAPEADRLAMVRFATQDEPRFEVSDMEIKRGGLSYTADTVEELHRAHPDDELFLILGWDAARLFRTWHEPDHVASLASFVILGRPGTRPPTSSEIAALGLPPERLLECFGGTPDISGSALRGEIAAGRPVTGKVPAAIERYIAERHLYRDNR
ncbi:MAG TPA: nicotinate-nucleotide adenylyltransferase [Candidatus Dormibacteraeota bacterium]|nr:nicotinate-nucleotide adenylyltransferase [Candidatus Dormibacteraeota bacterium]